MPQLMNGLAPNTASIFDAISRLDCIKDYVLVGGTALSLQIGTRMSEDLDFMSWCSHKDDKREVDWPAIKKELETIGAIEHCDILGMEHVEFILSGVKVSFYVSPNRSPLNESVITINNLRVADKLAIGAMKIEVMLRRSAFRDYYDIYSLIEDGQDLRSMIELAAKYSGHRFKTKNILAILTSGDRFLPDSKFAGLNPIYNVTAKDIERRIIAALR